MSAYYPKEYAEAATGIEACRYDYGVLELEANLEDEYGYFGIDMRDENVNTEKI